MNGKTPGLLRSLNVLFTGRKQHSFESHLLLCMTNMTDKNATFSIGNYLPPT